MNLSPVILYEALIKGYTEKQWERICTELPAFIIKKLPVRFVYDNSYITDKYQGIPIGSYNKLIAGVLANVDFITGLDFFNLDLKKVRINMHTRYKELRDVKFDDDLNNFEDFRLFFPYICIDGQRCVAESLV